MEQIPIYISPSPSLIIQRERRRGRKQLIKFAVAELILLCGLFALYIACNNAPKTKDEVINSVEKPDIRVQLISTVAAAEVEDEAKTYEVPEEENGKFTWMDYRTITSKTSEQWQMQQEARTDELGFRRYGDRYMVAMGTYYAGRCGKEFTVTLENGKSFEVIVADIKSDAHTDPKHQHRNGNVLEFIVDEEIIPNECRLMGDMSYASSALAASIAKIEEK